MYWSVPDTALNIEENIQAMALGYSHIVAITEKGNVYAWGNNTLGQLGLSTNAKNIRHLIRFTQVQAHRLTNI